MRQLTKKQKKMLEKIEFLKQMVNQLATDLAFGYIYREEYVEQMKKVNEQIDELENEMFDNAVHKAIAEVEP